MFSLVLELFAVVAHFLSVSNYTKIFATIETSVRDLGLEGESFDCSQVQVIHLHELVYGLQSVFKRKF